LLLGNAWSRLFIGVLALGALSLVLGLRLLPPRGRYAPEFAPERSSFAVVRRDHPFLLFVFSSVLASMTYVSIDALLPISLATSHGIPPAVWGFLIVINAGLVTLGQLRLTRAVSRFSPSVKLAVAMPLMGFPFVFLSLEDSVFFVAALMTVFVLGEMLWVPTSQTVVARFAPADVRGAYMGVYGSTSQAAWALTPFLGLQVRHAFGDATMWAAVAAVSVVAATVGAVAASERRVASGAP
jgi:predicted MFS family arabinose efflux permease